MRRHPDVLLCRTSFLECESDAGWPDALHPPSMAKLRIDETLAPSFLWPYFCTSTVMVRREIFDRVGGFSTALRVAEDVDFYLRVLAYGPRVAVLPDPLVFKRMAPGSLGDDSVVGYVQLLKVYQRYLVAFPHVRGWMGDKVVNLAFRRLHFAHACSLFRAGCQHEAREALVQAAQLGWGLDLLRVWLHTYLYPGQAGQVKPAPQLH